MGRSSMEIAGIQRPSVLLAVTRLVLLQSNCLLCGRQQRRCWSQCIQQPAAMRALRTEAEAHFVSPHPHPRRPSLRKRHAENEAAILHLCHYQHTELDSALKPESSLLRQPLKKNPRYPTYISLINIQFPGGIFSLPPLSSAPFVMPWAQLSVNKHMMGMPTE